MPRSTIVNHLRAYLLPLLLCVGLLIVRCSNQRDPVVESDSAIVAAEIAEFAPNQIIGMEYRSMTVATLNRIDVTTGERTPLWEMPAEAWVHQIAPINANAVGLSYSPVPADGEQPYQKAGIYALLLEEESTSLVPILESEQAGLSLYTPVWTPDGRYIFYVRYLTIDNTLDVTLMRYEVATGEQIEIVKDGVWPRVSRQGERLTYITVDPETQERGVVVSDWDGENGVEVVENGMYFDVDTPLFSADNDYIYFTASLAGQKVSWLDWLFGVKTAFAHADANVPVEWMRVPVGGGEHLQLCGSPPPCASAENKVIIYGDLSVADDTLYFTTTEGLFSMPAQGGSYTQHSAAATMRTFIGQVAAP